MILVVKILHVKMARTVRHLVAWQIRLSNPAGDVPEPDAVAVPDPDLPEQVRLRVIALTASTMTQLPTAELPVPLRRVAHFAPNRRARLGAAGIAAQLADDPVFRQRIAAKVLADAGDLGDAIEGATTAGGELPESADPIEAAALAYLTRPAGWHNVIETVADALRSEADSAAAEGRI